MLPILPVRRILTPQGRPVFGAGAVLTLSATDFAANAAIGTTIGTLSVLRGKGSYTHTLTSNPGSLFSISGNLVQVANASIGAGSYPVTIQSSNGAGSIVTRTFVLVATGASQSEAMPVVL